MIDLWIARAVLVLAIAAQLLLGHRGVEFGASLTFHLLAAAAWLWLVWQVVRMRYRPSFAEAFGLALALRALALPLDPQLSDDIWRYLFEGRLVLEGVNPYLTAPNAAEIASLRGPFWELINNNDIPAAYPPAVQFALAGGVTLSDGPIGMKLVFGAFDLGVFVLLWHWLPRLGIDSARAIVHGFCPLVVIEFAGEGHSDSLAVFATVASLYAATCRRWTSAGVMLAVATAGKLIPVVLLPFVLRSAGRELWKVSIGFAVVLVALYLPFIDWSEPLRIFEGTSQYVRRWRSNDSLFAVIYGVTEWFADEHRTIGGVEVQEVAKYPLAVLGGFVLAWMWFRRRSLERVALGFFVFFLVAAPTVHPWYVAFAIPLFAIRPNPGWLTFGATVFLAYHVLPLWLEQRRWEEVTWVKVVEYAPLYAGLFFEAWWLRRAVSRSADAKGVAESP